MWDMLQADRFVNDFMQRKRIQPVIKTTLQKFMRMYLLCMELRAMNLLKAINFI